MSDRRNMPTERCLFHQKCTKMFRLNQVRTVSIMYTLCSVIQMDNVLYLKHDDPRRHGYTVLDGASRIICHQLWPNHEESVKVFFNKVTENEWVLFLKIHIYRTGVISRVCNPISICKIVIKAFKELRAIQVSSNIFRIHCPGAVNIPALVY